MQVLRSPRQASVTRFARGTGIVLCALLAAPDMGCSQSDERPLARAAVRISELVAPHAQADLLSGVILVARGDEVVFHEAYGHSRWELGIPNALDTRFGIASITKSMTAILVQRLADAGRIDLDGPVEDYLVRFPRGPDGGVATIRHLLDHRSGVPHRVTTPVEETRPLSAADIVERIEASGLRFEPGSERLYSSAGYTALARILEIVEGEPFDSLLVERVFEPVGMTSATGETGQSLVPDRALPHRLGSDGRQIVVKSAPYKHLGFLTGAGSVHLAAEDLLRFVRAIESGVYGSDVAEETFGGDPSEWKGWYGRTNGYEASVDLLPSEELVFVFLSNLQSASNWQIRERVRDVLLGREVAAVPLPPAVSEWFEAPSELVGTYGPAEITFVDGDLFRGDNEFYPIAGEQYYIPGSGTRMRFRRDANGAVDALVSMSGERESVLAKSAASPLDP